MLYETEGAVRSKSSSTCRYPILVDFREKLDNNIQPNDDLISSAALYMEFFWVSAITTIECPEEHILVSYRVIMRLATFPPSNEF